MSNVTISPNMNLPVPVPSVDPGPDWANNVAACFGPTGSAIDAHDHSSGKGVPVNPAGLNINADLPMNSNNLTTVRTVRFSPQSAPLSGASDIGAIYESGADLYYNDGNGNQVRITQGGAVTGSSGTITGLPSGTASASYAGGTFTFQSATNTPAALSVGPVTIGAATASPHTVTIGASSSQASNIVLTLPTAIPGTTALQTLDSSGNMGTTTSPTLTGLTNSGSSTLATIFMTSGGATNPGYSFSGDNNTGVYLVSSGVLGFATAATQRLRIGTSAVISSLPLQVVGGGNAASQVFNTAIYSGSITGNGSTSQIAPPSGQIIGLFGFWTNATNGTSCAIGSAFGTSSPSSGVWFVENSAATNVFQLENFNGSTSTYFVVMFYQ